MYKELDILLEKARNGDTESSEILIKELNPLIIASIKRYYYKVEDFEDLVQEGRLTVLECIRDFDDSKDVYFIGYVKTMLKFLYLNKHKERIFISLNTPIGEDGNEEMVDMLESEEEILDEIIRGEGIEEIRYALSILTQRQKEVIIYFYFEGYSIPDIAKRMGITYRTVVNTKGKALEKLKRQLQNTMV